MAEKQKIRDAQSQQLDKYLSDFMNKVVVCETLSGKTITGVLAGYDRYTMVLIEMEDIKSTNPMGVIAVLVSSMQLYKFHAGMKRRIFDRLIGLSGPCHPFIVIR